MVANRLSNFRGPRPLLRIITFVAACITIILLGVALPISGTDEIYSDGWAPFTVALSFTSPAYTIAYSGSLLAVVFAQGWYDPIVDIVLDFIGCGLAFGWGFFTITTTASLGYERVCDYTYIDNPEHVCNLARSLNGLEYSSAILMLIFGLGHLIIMSLSCREVHERRMDKKRESFVELGDMNKSLRE